MKVSIKQLLFYCFLLCLCHCSVNAQEDVVEVHEVEVIAKVEDKELTEVPIDKSKVQLRKFDEQKLEEYRQSGRFNYNDDPDYESNWFQKLWNKFMRWLSDRVGYEGGAMIGKIIKWLVMALGIGGLLYFLLKASGNSIIKKERKDNFVNIEKLDETVSEETLDQLLEAAIQNGEHRAAIRLYFLKCLRKLDDNEEIIWRDHKTNQEYRHEISNDALSLPFGDLVNVYEHFWYGEFEITASEYQVHAQQFNSFLDKLSKVKA